MERVSAARHITVARAAGGLNLGRIGNRIA